MKIQLLLFLVIITASQSFAETFPVSQFSQNSLQGWNHKNFEGQTNYSFVLLDNKRLLKAVSHQSASGLIKKVNVDLTQTPLLQWQWRVQKEPDTQDETIKSGDDYPVRLYVVFSTGPFPWQKMSLTYVWSKKQAIGNIWQNAFSKNVRMLSLQKGSEKHNLWINEKRNISHDIQEIFHIKIRFIEAIALMTDSDNSNSSAIAYYGDIFFTND